MAKVSICTFNVENLFGRYKVSDNAGLPAYHCLLGISFMSSYALTWTSSFSENAFSPKMVCLLTSLKIPSSPIPVATNSN
jgi:hypothetical protein